MLPGRPKGFTHDELISPDTTRNVELKRIADALERIANSLFMSNKILHDHWEEDEELRKTIPNPYEDDESYPASPNDIGIRPNPQKLTEEEHAKILKDIYQKKA